MVPVGGVGAGPRAPSASDSIFDRGRLGDTMRQRLEQMAFAEQARRAAGPDAAAARDPVRAAPEAAGRVKTAGTPEGGLSPSTRLAMNRLDSQRDQLSASALQSRDLRASQTASQAAPGQRASLGEMRAAERLSEGRVRVQRSDDDRVASLRVDSRRAERVARRDEAEPAVATAAEDLRSRLKDESVRSADVMTEAATQRALRDYLRAG